METRKTQRIPGQPLASFLGSAGVTISAMILSATSGKVALACRSQPDT